MRVPVIRELPREQHRQGHHRQRRSRGAGGAVAGGQRRRRRPQGDAGHDEAAQGRTAGRGDRRRSAAPTVRQQRRRGQRRLLHQHQERDQRGGRAGHARGEGLWQGSRHLRRRVEDDVRRGWRRRRLQRPREDRAPGGLADHRRGVRRGRLRRRRRADAEVHQTSRRRVGRARGDDGRDVKGFYIRLDLTFVWSPGGDARAGRMERACGRSHGKMYEYFSSRTGAADGTG
mmetsp:Transcript_3058/g.12469  ORF Transcript_3058/g.12469 Transcript_3058/m.12469 type:complete len:230 (+) Transcript_3058:673-1362(+)